jgi:hypothetical protein
MFMNARPLGIVRFTVAAALAFAVSLAATGRNEGRLKITALGTWGPGFGGAIRRGGHPG